jgi:hypothetical protein
MKIEAGFLAALALASCVTVAQGDVLPRRWRIVWSMDGETSGTILFTQAYRRAGLQATCPA